MLALLAWQESPLDISGRQLLSLLHRSHPNVKTVVVGEVVRDATTLKVLHSIHPNALTHDPVLGASYLCSRIGGAIGRTVGDVSLRGGLVIHQPSGDILSHNPIAVQLLTASPYPVRLSGRGIQMAVMRIRRWLAEHDSSVVIETEYRTGEYRLLVPSGMRGQSPVPNLELMAVAESA